jgi:hypothetical protein
VRNKTRLGQEAEAERIAGDPDVNFDAGFGFDSALRWHL